MPQGAQALMKTLADAGVEVCFTAPGTSEMHFVAALDDERACAVLTLFEGVATGAADGYARMADQPAATLLHLGCGPPGRGGQVAGRQPLLGGRRVADRRGQQYDAQRARR